MLKLRKHGKQEICVVIRVDAEGGYIDLSKKRVTQPDAKDAETRYSNSKVYFFNICYFDHVILSQLL